jgi:hypothetical protein
MEYNNLTQNSLFKSGQDIYNQAIEYIHKNDYILPLVGVLCALSIVFELIKIDTLFSICTFLLFMFSLKECLNVNENNNSKQLLYYWISLYSLGLFHSAVSNMLTFMFGLFGTFVSNSLFLMLLILTEKNISTYYSQKDYVASKYVAKPDMSQNNYPTYVNKVMEYNMSFYTINMKVYDNFILYFSMLINNLTTVMYNTYLNSTNKLPLVMTIYTKLQSFNFKDFAIYNKLMGLFTKQPKLELAKNVTFDLDLAKEEFKEIDIDVNTTTVRSLPNSNEPLNHEPELKQELELELEKSNDMIVVNQEDESHVATSSETVNIEDGYGDVEEEKDEDEKGESHNKN